MSALRDIKVLNLAYLYDGGSVEIKTNKGVFYLDRRLGEETNCIFTEKEFNKNVFESIRVNGGTARQILKEIREGWSDFIAIDRVIEDIERGMRDFPYAKGRDITDELTKRFR